MPSKKKLETAEVEIPQELINRVVKGPMTQAEVDAVCRSLKKAVIERAMNAELSNHTGYEPGGEKPDEQSNHRNGSSGKTVITDEGPIRIEVPRDREGSFEPQIIGKHERRCARSVLQRASGEADPLSRWALAVRVRRGYHRACIAVAAKNARVVWAVLNQNARA
jgi:hypothetical protein